jgi:hypothetical protein
MFTLHQSGSCQLPSLAVTQADSKMAKQAAKKAATALLGGESQLVPENPLAAQQAAALLGMVVQPAPAPVSAGPESKEHTRQVRGGAQFTHTTGCVEWVASQQPHC